jgi:S-adenosylmethionine decarboxylase proenzyme
MQGLHLTADLHDCAAIALLGDLDALRRLCRQAVLQVGLTPVDEVFHRFPAPGGITGVVLLAESHLALHSWPELAALTLDVYVCNLGADNRERAEQLLAALSQAFAPKAQQVQRIERGALIAPA